MTCSHGRRKDFFREANSKIFRGVAFFPGGPTVVKFHFTNSKQREKPKKLTGKCEISK